METYLNLFQPMPGDEAERSDLGPPVRDGLCSSGSGVFF